MSGIKRRVSVASIQDKFRLGDGQCSKNFVQWWIQGYHKSEVRCIISLVRQFNAIQRIGKV